MDEPVETGAEDEQVVVHLVTLGQFPGTREQPADVPQTVQLVLSGVVGRHELFELSQRPCIHCRHPYDLCVPPAWRSPGGLADLRHEGLCQGAGFGRSFGWERISAPVPCQELPPGSRSTSFGLRPCSFCCCCVRLGGSATVLRLQYGQLTSVTRIVWPQKPHSTWRALGRSIR